MADEIDDPRDRRNQRRRELRAQRKQNAADAAAQVTAQQNQEARTARRSLTRPLRLRDLSPEERAQSDRLLSEKGQNLKSTFKTMAKSSKDPQVQAMAKKVASNPGLVQEPVDPVSMGRRLIDRTIMAATGAERMAGESLAGVGFYFKQRRALQEATGYNEEDMGTLTKASSRLSPNTNPRDETRTAIALANAHKNGYVNFTPTVIQALKTGHTETNPTTGAQKNISVDVSSPSYGYTGWMPVSSIAPEVLNQMRRGHYRDVMANNSTGVDWDGMSKVGLGSNFQNAHKVLLGDVEATPDPFKNPKQTGYAESISQATPDVEAEYMYRAAHLGQAARGDISHGQLAFDLTGQGSSNEGMLSNEAPIAGDIWTRAATSGQPLSIANRVADLFVTNKKAPRRLNRRGKPSAERDTVAYRDTRVTPVGIEHAYQQEAVENAAKGLQQSLGLPFTVPSRLVQETGGWGQPRREAGGDAAFNQAQRDEERANRPSKKPGKGAQGELF